MGFLIDFSRGEQQQCERDMCQTIKSPIHQRTCTCEADFDRTMIILIKIRFDWLIDEHHLNHVIQSPQNHLQQ